MEQQFIGHSIADSAGTIVSIDRAVGDLLHLAIDRIVGRSYLDITCPDDIVRNTRTVDDLVTHAPPIALRKRYVRSDGALVPTVVQVSRLADPKRGALIVGTIFLVQPTAAIRIPAMLLQEARKLRAFALARDHAFGADLFSNEGWTILLDLYLAEAEGRADDDDGSRPEIVDRWLRALESKGLIERSGDGGGAVQLSAHGFRTIETLIVSTAVAIDP